MQSSQPKLEDHLLPPLAGDERAEKAQTDIATATTTAQFAWVWQTLALLAIVGIFVFWQWKIFTPAYAEGDPDGYIVLAKRMARFEPLAVVDSDPYLHQTHVWVENDRGEVLPKFAPGYSVLLAIAYRISGGNDEAIFWVSPALGALALVGAFFLFRVWMPIVASLFATLAMAINATYIFYSSYLLSHTVEICFVVWGMNFLWRWALPDRVEGGATRSQTRDVLLGIAAGLILGASCAIRHTASLLVLVVVAAMIFRIVRDIRQQRFRFAPTIALALTYAIVPALMMFYNYRFFGSPFRTGYDLSGEQTGFSWIDFKDHATMLLHGINSEMAFGVFPLAILAIFFVGPIRERVLKFFWIVPAFLVYGSYYWAVYSMAYTRFMLPTLPLLVGSAFELLDRLAFSRGKRLAMMAGLIVFLAVNDYPAFVRFLGMESPSPHRPWPAPATIASNNFHAVPVMDAARGLSDAVNDDDAVVFVADGARDSIGVRRHFTTYALGAFTPGPAAFFKRPAQVINGEPLMQLSRRAKLADWYTNHTAAELREDELRITRAALDAGRRVIVFIPPSQLPGVRSQFGGEFEITQIKQVEIRGWGTWGVYDLKRSAPTTQPGSAPS